MARFLSGECAGKTGDRETTMKQRFRYLDEPQDDTFLYPPGWKQPDYGDLPETIPSVELRLLPG